MAVTERHRCISLSIQDEMEESNYDGDIANPVGKMQLERIDSEAEYDTDVEIEDRKEAYDATGRTAYYEACTKYKTNIVSYFLKHMNDTEINMPYHGVGMNGAKAIAAALIANTVTLKLNLMENSICSEGVKMICDMLKENCYINELNLSMNYLGPDGCNYVCEMLQQNINLKKLDLSHNAFGDNVGRYLSEAFKNNYKLMWLDLSGNSFSEKVGVAIGPGINANDALEYLNLSWNQLRSKATQEIAAGLKLNCTLKVLDLSWNGFSDKGAIALADALKINNTLTELYISNNRIGLDGAASLAKTLEANNTLEILTLDGNNVTCKGAHLLLTAVINKSDSAVRELHLKGVTVQDDFLQLYNASKESKNILVTADFRMPSAIEKLQEFIKANKSDWIEAFNEMDEIQCFRITIPQFHMILKKFSFELSVEEKYSLVDKLKKDSRGHIKYKDPLLGFEKEIVNTEVVT